MHDAGINVSHARFCSLGLDFGIFDPILGHQGATINIRETPGRLGMSANWGLMTGSKLFVYIYTHALATQRTRNLNNERGKSRVHYQKFRANYIASKRVYL